MKTVEYDPLIDDSLDFTKMKWKHPDFQMTNQERVTNLLDAIIADSEKTYGIEKSEFLDLMRTYCKKNT